MQPKPALVSCGMQWKSKNCEADQWRGREEQVSGNTYDGYPETESSFRSMYICGPVGLLQQDRKSGMEN